MTEGSAPLDDAATDVPSLEWFDRWTILLIASAGAVMLLAIALQFRVAAPWLTGPAETTIFISVGVILVASVGWAYTGMRFWAQLKRGEHVTRAERRRRVRAYAVAFGAAAFAFVALQFGPQDKIWLWAYVPAGALLAFGFTLRPKKRVRKRKRPATEASPGRLQS